MGWDGIRRDGVKGDGREGTRPSSIDDRRACLHLPIRSNLTFLSVGRYFFLSSFHSLGLHNKLFSHLVIFVSTPEILYFMDS